MTRIMPFMLVAAIAQVNAVFAQQDVASVTLVRVQLDSGRTMTAAVDARTTDERLWLRFDRETAVLYRPIDWNRVTRIVFDGDSYNVDQFQQVLPQVKSERVIDSPATVAPAKPSAPATNPHTPYSELAQRALSGTSRVQSISIDAYVANWDADTEVDGIVLTVDAVDQFGAPLAIDGTLSVELVAERRSQLRPQLRQRRDHFQRFGNWTKMMRAEDSGQQVFFLPFQAIHPEFDHAIGSYGLVHAKLAVPGHGVFEASISDLRIRPVSRIRDRIQNSHARRFHQTESTGRAKYTGGPAR
jgi:hypothetical protein